MYIKKVLSINPIIVKELRSRMRGPRPFITITTMLILLSGITYGVYRIALTSLNTYSGSPVSPQLGQTLFVMLSFLILLAICILTPAVTASAISGEREQLTYEMLLSTPLHPARLLWGKLFSSLSYIFLLIFSAIPIASLIFVFGGVTLREMLKSFIILITVTITIGVLGIFLSSVFKRTSRATVISYIIIVVIIFGSILVYVAAGILQQDIPPRWIIAINPISALASALSNTSTQFNSVLSFVPILGVDLNMLGGDVVSFNSIPRPLYHYSLPLYGFVSTILYFFAIRFVMPAKRWKISRKDILIFLGVVFLLCAIILILFFGTTEHYEQAINPTGQDLSFAVGAAVERMVEPAIPAPVKEFSNSNTPTESLSIDEQAAVYALAIDNTVMEFVEDRQIEVQSIYLIENILDTQGGESYTFMLPMPLQVAISERISSLSNNIVWEETIEAIYDDPNIGTQTEAIVLNLGDLKIDPEGTITLYITLNFRGVAETQKIFSLLKSQDDEWKISVVEEVD